jgi:type I restriction enzyme, S subunit
VSETRTIGDLAGAGVLLVGDGYRTKRSELAQSGFRIIRVADIGDGRVSLDSPDFVSAEFARVIGHKMGRQGDVLLTTKGTVGRVAVLPDVSERVVYSPQICFFRVQDPKTLAPAYLRYWFQSPSFTRQANGRMNNTDMAAYINLADIRSLQLQLPSAATQRAIAEVLGALDDKIVTNEGLVARAAELSLALVASRQPGVPLSEVVAVRKRTLTPETFGPNPVAHFSLPAYDDGKLPAMTDPAEIKSAKVAIDAPAVLVSKLNPRFPRIWDLPVVPSGGQALASTEFLVLDSEHASSSLLWAILSQPSFSQELQGKAAGTSGSHQRVRPDALLATDVIDPRLVSERVHTTVTSLGKTIHFQRQESRSLAVLRDTLLPQLMSGKIRVKDAERAVSEVV